MALHVQILATQGKYFCSPFQSLCKQCYDVHNSRAATGIMKPMCQCTSDVMCELSIACLMTHEITVEGCIMDRL